MEGTGRVVNSSPCTSVDWNNQQRMAQMAAVQGAYSASKIDDAPFEAALDSFATAQGFVPGKDKNRGISVAHEYQHPAGILVTAGVSDKSGITSVANSALSGLGGMLGGNTAVSGRLNKLMGSLQQGPKADGDPVEGFGFPATWKQVGPGEGTLTVLKDNRVLSVNVRASIPPNDQYAWARAFALAGLTGI
jgi:hypothetical protein